MTDQWNVESEAPQKKGGLPAWFWWTCGTGCLLAVVVAVGIGIFGYFAAREMADPERVRAKLVDVLPCDQWPEGYTPRGGGWGIEQYFITWPDRSATVIVYKVGTRADLTTLLDPDGFQNKIGNSDLTAGEMELQGRTVQTMTFKAIGDLAHLRVDIAGEKEPYALLDIMVQESEAERLPETVIKFLEPFDIWRGEG